MVTTVTDNSPQSINTSLFSLDKDIQEIKKVTDKLSGVNLESNVISVNGKQGIVELTASDVKALPDTTVIPTTTSELENTSGFITSSDSITGNAATATTADKVKNALTVNGKTYDGSAAIDAGVQTIANGGTGQTTQADINKAFVGGLTEGDSDVTDGTMFVSSYASDNGFADTNAVNVPYKRKFSRVWEYIKSKISSVLGLTASNYGGKAKTAGTADKAIQDGNGNNIVNTYMPKSVIAPQGYVPKTYYIKTIRNLSEMTTEQEQLLAKMFAFALEGRLINLRGFISFTGADGKQNYVNIVNYLYTEFDGSITINDDNSFSLSDDFGINWFTVFCATDGTGITDGTLYIEDFYVLANMAVRYNLSSLSNLYAYGLSFTLLEKI